MFTPSWLSEKSLKEQLFHQPWRWQLSQAVRLVEGAGRPFRLATDPTYGYPCAEISSARQAKTGWHFTVTSHALSGYHGTLPYVYQDAEQEQRLVSGDNHFYDFLSLLQKRVLELSTQVERSSNLSVRYEERANSAQPLPESALILFGIVLPAHHCLPAANLVRYAMSLHRPTNIQWFSRMLKDYFQLDIQIAPPSLVRLAVSHACQTSLQQRIDHRSVCVGHLGQNAVIGGCCYLLSSRVKVVIKVSSYAQYQAILSDSTLAPAIVEMCSLYFAHGTKFCLQIQCPRCLLPVPKLLSKPCHSAARLGQQSCLKGKGRDDTWVTTDFPVASI